jgi:hypothetical protein
MLQASAGGRACKLLLAASVLFVHKVSPQQRHFEAVLCVCLAAAAAVFAGAAAV